MVSPTIAEGEFATRSVFSEFVFPVVVAELVVGEVERFGRLLLVEVRFFERFPDELFFEGINLFFKSARSGGSAKAALQFVVAPQRDPH